MAAPAPNRRQSTRNPRTSTTRPLNYYARPFGNRNSGAPSGGPQDPNNANTTQIGFYPAITHFTDAVDALPQEMIRHFSMLKEVEAKIYQPDEELQRLVDAIANLPPPPRTYEPAHTGHFPGLSARNSVRNGSVRSVSANSAAAQAFLGVDQRQQINGMAATPAVVDQNDIERQQLFTQLRYTIMAMSPMLDEKNAVLSTANQTLKGQLERMDSSYKHVGSEISPEARYGSRTHWAYVAEKEPAKKAGPERTRREAGTNNYVPADPELAARSEARREAVKEAKKKRAANQQQADSDFDDAPVVKKSAKGRKPGTVEADANKSAGLGITNGAGTNGAQQGKKRKAGAGSNAAAPAMERTSSAMRGAFAQSSRETPMSDQAPKKKAKAAAPAAPPKKRQAATPRSPHVASSPIVSTFQVKETVSKPPLGRTQHSSNYNMPPSLLSEVTHPLPSSPTSNAQTNGFGMMSMHTEEAESAKTHTHKQSEIDREPAGPPIALLQDPAAPEIGEELKEEEADQETSTIADATVQQAGSTAKSGRASKVATPQTATFPNPSGTKAAKPSRKDEANSGDHSHASSDSGHPDRPSRRKGRHGSTSAASLLNEATGSRKSTPRARSPVDASNQSASNTMQVTEDADAIIPRNAEPADRAEETRPNGSEKPPVPTQTPGTLTKPTLKRTQSDSDADEATATPRENKSLTSTARTDQPPAKLQKTSSRPSTSTGKSHKESTKTSSVNSKDHNNSHTKSHRGEGTGRTGAKNKDKNHEREQYDDLRNDRIPPDEPTYCYCNDVSYGQMIACDNEECPREWFHLKCTELDHVPDDPNWQWICEICKAERAGEKDKNHNSRENRVDRDKEKNGKR